MADVKKQIKVKTGSLNRIQKDLKAYVREQEKQGLKVKEMKDAGQDAYDIKKQEEVLVENDGMINDTKVRLEAAYRDLLTLLENHQPPNPEDSDWKDAQNVIELVRPQLQ
eukprot:TRINITY_DN17146_c0_g1_i1.p1 TRINITY_DN17146_c0_g1~~TRINITY_DN17146_c0_g1_i1.p1  ORF type:complete len:110 (-),score=32.48 TRINITY_DN17146_c0_g1_i1:57-386(-)